MKRRHFKIILAFWWGIIFTGIVHAIAQSGPSLSISRGGGQATLSWSSSNSIFLLQCATNLSKPINWNWTGTGGYLGQTNIQITTAQSFFRLSQLTPIFQYAIFYDLDLEINPGSGFNVSGDVWCNGSIWASPSGSLTFGGYVTATGQINYLHNPNDPFTGGSSNNVSYTLATNNPVQDAGPLGFPTPLSTNANRSLTNFLQLMNLPPASLAPPNYAMAYSSNGLAYFYNAVDLIISNSAKGLNGTMGTNITVFYQNPNNPVNYLLPVPGDVIVSSNVTGSGASRVTNIINAYSWVTNASFYDFREGDTVQAIQINVVALNAWLMNASANGGLQYNNLNDSGVASKGHQINAIYVYNSVPLMTGQLPAVRVFNGAQLPPDGLTVITPQPVYLWGNYNIELSPLGNTSANTTNTTYTHPAAVMADAVTILSSQWEDDFTASTSLGTRQVVVSDTVNAALLVGIDPSVTDSANTKHYSGGAENFLRLLENWNGVPLWYNGSEVAMFASRYATNYWQSPGVYYNAPIRDWGVDANFKNPNKLPPLTPLVVNFITP